MFMPLHFIRNTQNHWWLWKGEKKIECFAEENKAYEFHDSIKRIFTTPAQFFISIALSILFRLLTNSSSDDIESEYEEFEPLYSITKAWTYNVPPSNKKGDIEQYHHKMAKYTFHTKTANSSTTKMLSPTTTKTTVYKSFTSPFFQPPRGVNGSYHNNYLLLPRVYLSWFHHLYPLYKFGLILM